MGDSVLIVDSQPTQLDMCARTLTTIGYDVTAVTTFEGAKRRLAAPQPLTLLIADIRLGPYNGLHVALRARSLHPRICIIITDRAYDPMLERQARQIGAMYVVKPVSAAKVAELVTQLLKGHTDSSATGRRWHRINLSNPLRAAVGALPVRLVDMSYGGVRLKFQTNPGGHLPDRMEVLLSDRDLCVTIHPVWERAADDRDGWLCGGEVIVADNGPAQEWRRFVDSLNESPEVTR